MQYKILYLYCIMHKTIFFYAVQCAAELYKKMQMLKTQSPSYNILLP